MGRTLLPAVFDFDFRQRIALPQANAESQNQRRRTRVSVPHSQAHSWQFHHYGGAPAFALTLGEHAAAVLPCNRADDKKTKARSLHMTERAIGNAVKAF